MAPPEETPSGSHRTPAHSFRLAVVGISVAAGVFLVLMLIFRKDIDGAMMVSAMTSLFAVIATIIGAYFGIKITNATAEDAQADARDAHDREAEAMGALDPAKAEEITEKREARRRNL